MHKLYIVVRNDLEPGLQIAQAIHAAQQFAYYNYDSYNEWFYGKDWQRPQEPRAVQGVGNIVVLQVPDEPALRTLANEVAKTFLEMASFQEPDLNNELTAIAIGGEGAEKFTRKLPLALRPQAKAA